MNIRWYIIIFIFTITLFSVGSYTLTRAYFTDTAVSVNNTFITAENFDSLSEPTEVDEVTEEAGGIVINEVFESSDNSAEWIELHNTSNNPVDISNWKISDNDSSETLPRTDPVPAGGYVVIVTDPSNASNLSNISNIVVLTGTGKGAIGNGLANSGDKLVLKNGDTIVDQLSWGNNKDVFNPSLPSPIAGKTLQRIPNGEDTDTVSDWKIGDPTIGGAND